MGKGAFIKRMDRTVWVKKSDFIKRMDSWSQKLQCKNYNGKKQGEGGRVKDNEFSGVK